VLIDYVFKARARAAYGGGPELLRLFALFYTGVSLLSVLAQFGLSRRTLERLGLARTVVAREIGNDAFNERAVIEVRLTEV
jgi:hypothetical protein